MRLEEQIDQIRADILAHRYTTAAKESAGVIEFAFREIFRRSIGQVDGAARRKAFEAEKQIGGPGKDVDSFTLGELVGLFRDSKLFEAYTEATGTQLRALTMINFGQVVSLRNRMQHDSYEASRGEAQLCLHCVENMLEAFGILTLEAAQDASTKVEAVPEPQATYPGPTREGRASTYTPHIGAEVTRLQAQSRLHRPLDMQMFDFALEGMPSTLTGLDIGCARGEVTTDRFGSHEQFRHVVAVDKDERCIQLARASYPDTDRWTFEHIDVEGITGEDELREVLGRHHPPGPTVVFMALVLHHVATPIRLLKEIRTLLPPGSKVIVRTIDDGSALNFPDTGGRLRYLVEMTQEAPGQADRLHGRKLHHQLYRAGFRDIRFFIDPILLPNLTEQERRLVYQVHFSHRPDLWETALANGLAEPSAKEQVEAMRDSTEEYELELENPSFFFYEALFGAVATVG